MHTPAHLVFNLAVLGRSGAAVYLVPVFAGALLPDLPMFIFYAVERFIFETPNQIIWREAYFEPGWQYFIDYFNSIPIIAVVLSVALWFKSRFVSLLCLSMLLHIALDLPVHHDDGHRHFLPFSQWRFESPVSYWDLGHFGRIMSWLEALGLFVCCFFLVRRDHGQWFKGAVWVLVLWQIADLTVKAKFYVA